MVRRARLSDAERKAQFAACVVDIPSLGMGMGMAPAAKRAKVQGSRPTGTSSGNGDGRQVDAPSTSIRSRLYGAKDHQAVAHVPAVLAQRVAELLNNRLQKEIEFEDREWKLDGKENEVRVCVVRPKDSREDETEERTDIDKGGDNDEKKMKKNKNKNKKDKTSQQHEGDSSCDAAKKKKKSLKKHKKKKAP